MSAVVASWWFVLTIATLIAWCLYTRLEASNVLASTRSTDPILTNCVPLKGLMLYDR